MGIYSRMMQRAMVCSSSANNLRNLRNAPLFFSTSQNISALQSCQSRVSSSSPTVVPKSPPLLMLPFELSDSNMACNYDNMEYDLPFFNPKNRRTMKLESRKLPEELSRAYYVSSTKYGWLAYICSQTGAFYLIDLLTYNPPKIISLPPTQTLPTVFRVIPYGNSYLFMVHHFGAHKYLTTPHCFRERIRVSMSSPPHPNSNSTGNGYDVCLVMIIHSKTRDLAFCRLGDAHWINLTEKFGLGSFLDVIYSERHKLFYTLTDSHQIVSWDPLRCTYPRKKDIHQFDYPEITATNFIQHVSLYLFRTVEYLVETPKGDILRVIRCIVNVNANDGSFVICDHPDIDVPYRTVLFHVYKLDLTTDTAEIVTSLEDAVLFVGYNESFSLPVSDYPELKRNSIYFADNFSNAMMEHDANYGGHDAGIYCLEDNCVEPLYDPFEWDAIDPTPIWVARHGLA